MAEEKKKRKLFEKIIMGAIIGGAIGSVLGATLTPKKKNEPLIIEGIPAKKKRKIVEFLKKLSRKKKGIDKMKEIPNEMAIEEKDHD